MTDPDSEWVDRLAAGDTAALEPLYRRYAEKVWRHAWFRTHSRDAAADIVQDTFLRVARSIGGFQRRSSFSTWLFAVARSVAVQYLRKTRREQDRLAVARRMWPLTADVDPSHESEQEEIRHAVRQAVAKLSGAQRDAIVLCELMNLSLREAAVSLGWTESRVKTTLFRARRSLRDRIEREMRGPRRLVLRDCGSEH